MENTVQNALGKCVYSCFTPTLLFIQGTNLLNKVKLDKCAKDGHVAYKF